MKIIARGNKLYLSGMLGSQRIRKSLNQADTPVGWILAEKILHEISLDIALERFTGCLDDYLNDTGVIREKRKKYGKREPFTKDEMISILKAVREDSFKSPYSAYTHSHYADWLEFMAITGCRPAEAIGLRGCDLDLSSREITIGSALARSKTGLTSSKQRRRKTTKNEKVRHLKMNDRLFEILSKRVNEETDDYKLVFRSPKGLAIDDNNFRLRVWKRVLSGLEIKYRQPYCIRHTAGMLMLEAGLPLTKIAYILGNEVETLTRHYLHPSKGELPDIF